MTNYEFEKHWNSVKGTAYKLVREYNIYGFEKEDLMQEARIVLVLALQEWDPEKGAKLNSYYYQKLKWKLQHLAVKAKSKTNFYNHLSNSAFVGDLIKNHIPSQVQNPEEEMEDLIRRKKIKETFAKLSTEEKHIIRLRQKGLNTKEIAYKMGYSSPTLHKRLNNIREKFLKLKKY